MTIIDGFLFGIGFVGAMVACCIFIIMVSAITEAILTVLNNWKNDKE